MLGVLLATPKILSYVHIIAQKLSGQIFTGGASTQAAAGFSISAF